MNGKSISENGDYMILQRGSHDLMIGNTPGMKRIAERLLSVAAYDANIMLLGDSGVGKSRFAEMIHLYSEREKKPFVTINCGAIPQDLMESELFGYERGAFTGANARGKIGLIETAEGGTLFLDEIGDLPLAMQAKLLKVIQERCFYRIGGLTERKIDFRLVSATNRNLERMVKLKAFREDLYYRLNVIPIRIPALKERKGDIPFFLDFFARKYGEKYGKHVVFSPEAIRRMESYIWPGNVRELENVVEQIAATAEQEMITEECIPQNICTPTLPDVKGGEEKSLKEILEAVEKQVILQAYEKYGTTTKVAAALKISQASASIKIRRYRLSDNGNS